VGPAADIYSLGCVLYEALTARVPYPADSEVGRIVAHLHDPPPRASEHWPGVPPALDAVIARALDKEPGGRFVSAAEFSIAVAHLSDHSSARTSKPSSSSLIARNHRRRRRRAGWNEPGHRQPAGPGGPPRSLNRPSGVWLGSPPVKHLFELSDKCFYAKSGAI